MSQLSVSADELSPGLRLGRYELIRRLAVGGMAEIYLARATGIEGFEKLIVLKRILPQFATNIDFVTMFLDEARLSATLQHPNIAQVHDIGQWEGSYFFTMEYVRGEDMRSILRASVEQKRNIPLSSALSIIAGAAAGLHAAHEKRALDGTPLNVVHRDVSPSNVLVSYDGSVKLVDFGVAKAAQRQTHTQAGTLKGKVSYMSPEQCRGDALDRRSDIFALGILLYEITLRRRLFSGESEFAIMTKIVNRDVPPVSERFPKYPKDLEAIVMKALARNPDDRYSTAQQMQLDIEDFARRHRLSTSTVKLGQFMAELFVHRLHAEEDRVVARAQTDELSIQIQIDEAIEEADPASKSDGRAVLVAVGGTEPTRVGSGLASGMSAQRAKLEAAAALDVVALPMPAVPVARRGRAMGTMVLGLACGAAIAAAVFFATRGSEPDARPAATTIAPAADVEAVGQSVQSVAGPVPKSVAGPVPKSVAGPNETAVMSAMGDGDAGESGSEGGSEVEGASEVGGASAVPVEAAKDAPETETKTSSRAGTATNNNATKTKAATETKAATKTKTRTKTRAATTTKTRTATKTKAKKKTKKKKPDWGLDSPFPPPKGN